MFGKEEDKQKLILEPITAAEAKEKSVYNHEIYRKSVITEVKDRVWDSIYKAIARGETSCYCDDTFPVYATLSEVIAYFQQLGYNIRYIPKTNKLSIKWE